jgi:predicted DNA-binding protein
MNELYQKLVHQKRLLESLDAGSPEEQNAITKLIRLNREGLQFAQQLDTLHARNRFRFLEKVIEAVRSDEYEDYKLAVDHFEQAIERKVGRSK